ncbi:MAG: TolC family outer membrane protein [Methylococcales bacterium]|nr:TolC family outer membrane protein [Methylococcales bacterium]
MKFALGVSSLIVSCTFSPLSSAQSLQQAIQQTIDENPEIQSAKSERSAVEHEINQAKAGYFPTIDIAAGIGWEQSTNPTTRGRGDGTVSYGREEASIQLRQMVFDGLATPSEVNRHKARTDSRAYTVFGQSEITALSAVDSYLNILRRQELLALAKDNLLVHQRTNDQIQLRSERGIGRKADAEQSKGRLALAEKNTLSEIGNLKDAETAFLRVVGELPKDLEIAMAPGDALPENLDQAVEQAVANHPILKSANADIDSAFAQHDTARSPYMPRLDIEAGATHNNDLDGIKGKNEDVSAMLRLRYNLFNGGKDLARRKETAQLINQSKDIRDNTYRQVVESMRLSWVAHQTVKSQLDFFKSHQDASIKTNTAYQKQFNLGQRTLLDLLDSANEMFVAKSAYTNAKYDELFSQYRILASKGGLNKYLGVKLPEEAKTLAFAEKEPNS